MTGLLMRRRPRLFSWMYLGPGGEDDRRASLWIMTKSVGLMLSSLAVVLSPFLFLMGDPDAPVALTFGLIWLPGVEFLPGMFHYQKIVTLLRCLASVGAWAVWFR
ncbi:hypothetical protein SAMN02745206_00675 [Desulfacinum infernum DSM 9756]|uniref:Uncharacterized protein n=1 Tax=Desulfacinum infernum DSM 9756 TaxID=1121391 RepID=A0A1M4VIM7_9BACT|nr:hypothetical protein SAMN02745206_00675 [Desulfacinum infernum DSM 9756]